MTGCPPRPTREWPGPALLVLAALCGAWTAFVAWTGGLEAEIAGIAIRSRNWHRPAFAAVALATIGGVLARRRLPAYAAAIAGALPLLAACFAAAVGVLFGTFAAGGADSYGYVSQAVLFAQGRLTMDAGPYAMPDVPGARTLLVPLGYTPGRTPDELAPVYPPGLPLLMAPLAAIHPSGVFLLVPLCAAAAVWGSARLGRELGDGRAGQLAALLVGCSPTFLYQAVQPMSDVPVTAAWIAALLAAARPGRGAAAGLLAGLALLIRPNLAPLSVFVIGLAGSHSPGGGRGALRAAAAMLPPLLLLGGVQYVRYGSPLASGYGPIEELYSWRNVAPNLALYPRWLVDTHTPFVWLWLLSPLWIVRAAPPARRVGWVCYGFGVAVVVSYLPYAYFRPDEWFYTRFMLPALPVALLFGCALVLWPLRRVAGRAADPVALLLAALLAGLFVRTAWARGAFDMHREERKYPGVGAFVRARLPASAFVLAMQHSGSIRYYSGRATLRWDLLDPASLDRAVGDLRRRGHEVFVVLDPDEELAFRRRFRSAGQRTIDELELLGTIDRTRVHGIR